MNNRPHTTPANLTTPTNMSEQEILAALSEKPSIAGREDFRNTAVLVPLVWQKGEPHLLFEVRAAHIRQGGEVCFPGGHFEREKDRDFRDTAIRETCEELGLTGNLATKVRSLRQLDTLVSSRGLLVECYLGRLDINSPDELAIEKDEVASVFTLPLAWFRENPPEVYRKSVVSRLVAPDTDNADYILPLKELGLSEKYRDGSSVWRPRVLVYRSTPLIWGLTALIIDNLVKKIYGT